MRSENGIKARDPLQLHLKNTENAKALLAQSGWTDAIQKRAFIESLELTDSDVADAVSFMVGTEQFQLVLPITINVAAELEKAKTEKKRLEGMKTGLDKKLSNERFVNNAPEAVVAKERKKLADTEAKIDNLETLIRKLHRQVS